MEKAPDSTFLEAKVSLILGVFGFLRITELSSLLWTSIEKKEDIYVISLERLKGRGTKKLSSFIVSGVTFVTSTL